MITYLTVIYKNYSLLDLQREQFDKLGFENYKFIIVDNTPNSLYSPITPRENEIIIRRENEGNEFDGVSHGSALDLGVSHCDTDIICILDSDFFFLSNVQDYIINKFESDYLAIGAEFWNRESYGYFDSFSSLLENIPCCFCGFYKTDLIRNLSWVIRPEEVNTSTGYLEVGFRIRKYINENYIKTFGWKCKSENNMDNFVYNDENGNPVGIHVVAGSHRNLSMMVENIKSELNKY